MHFMPPTTSRSFQISVSKTPWIRQFWAWLFGQVNTNAPGSTVESALPKSYVCVYYMWCVWCLMCPCQVCTLLQLSCWAQGLLSMTLCPMDKPCFIWPSRDRTARAPSSFLSIRQTSMLGNAWDIIFFTVSFHSVHIESTILPYLIFIYIFSPLQGPRRDKQHYSWPSVTSCHWW